MVPASLPRWRSVFLKVVCAISLFSMDIRNVRILTNFQRDIWDNDGVFSVQAMPEIGMTDEYRQEIAQLRNGCPTVDLQNVTYKRPRRHANQAIHIVSQVYNATHPAKRYENERALTQNLLNPAVAALHVLPEYMEDYHYARHVAATVNKKHKVVLGIHLARRMNYSDAFSYANTRLAGKYVSIQHADIFLDQSFDDAYFFDVLLDRPETALAMSRHEDGGCVKRPGNHEIKKGKERVSYCMNYKGPYSHDAFMFKAPLPTLRLDYLNFMPNHMGAENVVIFELLIGANLTVYNACRRYKVQHVDCNRFLINNGVQFANALPHINVGRFAPAKYQRFGTAFPECRNTLALKGFTRRGFLDLERARRRWLCRYAENRTCA